MVFGVLTVAGVIVATFLTQAVDGQEDCLNTVQNSTEWCEHGCCGEGGSDGEEEVCCDEEFSLVPVIIFSVLGGMVVLFVLYHCFKTELKRWKDAKNKVAAGSSASLHYYRTSAPEEVNATTDPEQPPPPQPAPYETAYKRPTNPQPAVPAYHPPTVPTNPLPTVPTDPQPAVPTNPLPTDPVYHLPAVPTDPQPAVPAYHLPTVPVYHLPAVPTNPLPTDPVYHLPAVPTGPLPSAPSALYADNAAPPNYHESRESENAAKGREPESEPPSYSSLFQVKS